MLAQEMVWSLKQNNEGRNMETEEKLKKRIAYEKMLAGITVNGSMRTSIF